MKYGEQISSFFWIIIGLFFCILAYRYGLYADGVPGSGLFPFLVGILLVLLGSIVWVSAFKESRRGGKEIEPLFPQADSWKRVFLAVVAIVAYMLVLDSLGFLLATFLFIAFLLRFVEPQKWSTVITASALTAVISYVIFQVFLKSNLPKGFLGI
ncbi:MAG: tripartite tricarboxylate transporter TctB family protein [Deltaproteobacteria bacterium]|nr:tripartite tricarboxylate transporter TctB family protein [Deltaproteobacteria bacterium]